MNTFKLVVFLVASFLLAACGPSTQNNEAPSEDSSNQGIPAEKVIEQTGALVAEQSFDFKTERDINFNFKAFPSLVGKYNVYTQYAHYDHNLDKYYPDYSTLVASYVATPHLNYPLQVNNNWDYLILEWLPMDGLSNETYMKVDLDSQTMYSLSF